MSPKEVLVLLEIVEKASKSAAFAHITGAAHDALVKSQLNVLPEAHSDPSAGAESDQPQAKKGK